MRKWLLSAIFVSLSGAAHAEMITGTEGSEIEITEIAEFDGAWAMTFLPDGRMLVTAKFLSLMSKEMRRIIACLGLLLSARNSPFRRAVAHWWTASVYGRNRRR